MKRAIDVGLVLLGLGTVVAALVLTGCDGGGTVTGPTPVEVPVADPAEPEWMQGFGVTPVAAPTPAFWEGSVLFRAGWNVRNVGTEVETWTAYVTSFDNQVRVLAAQTMTVKPGDHFEGSFDRTCVQVDVQQGIVRAGQDASAAPFLSGFINGSGQVVHASQARNGCDVPTPQPTPTPEPSPTPTPTPTPSPSPSPSPSPEPTPPPCVPTWVAQTAVREVGAWGACEKKGNKCEKSATVTITINEVNSCTQESRVKSTRTETLKMPCTCPPPPVGLCYYRVSCGDQEDSVVADTKCSDQNQQALCEAAIGGTPLAPGMWLNFVSGELHNHCQFTVPGFSHNDFQLTPGQSDDACLNKKDS